MDEETDPEMDSVPKTTRKKPEKQNRRAMTGVAHRMTPGASGVKDGKELKKNLKKHIAAVKKAQSMNNTEKIQDLKNDFG